MNNLRFWPLLIVFVLVSAFISVAASEPSQLSKEFDHNRKGQEYYDEAFYQRLPNGKQQEADEFFDLAVAEFKAAIAANPRSAVSHRNLARTYYVRKDFLKAAETYRMVTILEPLDIDAFAQLALSYTQLDRFAEAIQTLELAKTKTDKPDVLGKLDGYILKIKEHNQVLGTGGSDHD